MAYNAGWHKICHLKFNKTKLEHYRENLAQKRWLISHHLYTHVPAVAKLTSLRPPVFSVIHKQACMPP